MIVVYFLLGGEMPVQKPTPPTIWHAVDELLRQRPDEQITVPMLSDTFVHDGLHDQEVAPPPSWVTLFVGHIDGKEDPFHVLSSISKDSGVPVCDMYYTWIQFNNKWSAGHLFLCVSPVHVGRLLALNETAHAFTHKHNKLCVMLAREQRPPRDG